MNARRKGRGALFLALAGKVRAASCSPDSTLRFADAFPGVAN